MAPEEQLMEKVKVLLVERGNKALEIAKAAVMEEKFSYQPLEEALNYFILDWNNVAHPALLSLACEAVGGKPENTANIAAAFVLLTGAADIHDDIIDQSMIKGSKLTVFGKFGKDIAIVAGDVLWFKGMLMLNEACDSLPKNQKQTILKIAKQAFFDIGSAESKETGFRRKLDLSPDEYLFVIKMKVAVAKAAAAIGAVLGNGTHEEVEILSNYGEMVGVLMTIRDEFIDMFELDELKNRLKNECLPLPMLCAFQEGNQKNRIIKLLEAETITEETLEKMLEIVMTSMDVKKLTKQMQLWVESARQSLQDIKNNKGILVGLIESTLEDLPN